MSFSQICNAGDHLIAGLDGDEALEGHEGDDMQDGGNEIDTAKFSAQAITFETDEIAHSISN